MSRPRFAAITADLLARKGEARPWNEAGKPVLGWENAFTPPPVVHAPVRELMPAPVQVPMHVQVRVPMPAPIPEAANEPPPAPLPAGEIKKCTVRMTHRDYERLGILAVKRNTTRHHLLQEAVDSMLTGLPMQFGAGCACLGEERPARWPAKRSVGSFREANAPSLGEGPQNKPR